MFASFSQQNSDVLAPGTALRHGELTVTQVLAYSNFAVTYVARDEKLQREVAVKEFFPFGCRRDRAGQVVVPPLTPQEEFAAARTQFLEEARVLAQFHHPGVVAVHTFFEAANTAYMVMELLHGDTLRTRLETSGPLGESEILTLARKIGDSLQAVHDAGLLHRDLKPDNIFACRDGRLVLIDFGLSTRLEIDAYGTRQLDSLARFGTPGYAPPEQYTQGATQNAASDVYSLGATLYHLLTGTPPPPAPDRAFGVPLEPPSHLAGGVSDAMQSALLCALQIKPEQRPQSVHEFLALLNSGEGLLVTRITLLTLLQIRREQLLLQLQRQMAFQHPAPHSLPATASPHKPPPHSSNSPQLLSPPDEETGCMPLLFGLYLVFWLIAIVVCGAWFAIMFFSVKW